LWLRYWGFGLLAAVGAGCAGLALHGCSCDESAYGLHQNDAVRTTIIALRYPDGGTDNGGPSCEALGDLPAGTTLDWNAHLVAEGEGPGCAGWAVSDVLPVSSDGVDVTTWPPSRVDAGGCTGSVTFRIRALNANASVYGPVPDGGNAPWVLERLFAPDPGDGGGSACPVPQGGCVDWFVASSRKL
jgi:hypothetical protein